MLIVGVFAIEVFCRSPVHQSSFAFDLGNSFPLKNSPCFPCLFLIQWLYRRRRNIALSFLVAFFAIRDLVLLRDLSTLQFSLWRPLWFLGSFIKEESGGGKKKINEYNWKGSWAGSGWNRQGMQTRCIPGSCKVKCQQWKWGGGKCNLPICT